MSDYERSLFSGTAVRAGRGLRLPRKADPPTGVSTGTPDQPTPVEDEGFRSFRAMPGLDGLRAIAVTAVILFSLPRVTRDDMARVLDGGHLGVDLFIVLSGFLLTGLLLTEDRHRGRVGVLQFYRRRGMRIVPALYVLLLAHAAWSQMAPNIEIARGLERDSILGAALFVSNWQWVIDGPGIFSHPTEMAPGLTHLWSVAILAQFYLVWPLVVLVIAGIRTRAWLIIGLIVVAILAVVGWRQFLLDGGTKPIELYYRTDARADAFLVGALAGHLWVRKLVPATAIRWLVWPSVAFIGYAIYTFNRNEEVLYRGLATVFAVSAAIVILATADRLWPGRYILEFAPLRALGIISFGLFLWHMPVMTAVVRQWGDRPMRERLAAAIGLTLVAAVVSWFVIERPVLRWKSRLDRAHRATVRPTRIRPPTRPQTVEWWR